MNTSLLLPLGGIHARKGYEQLSLKSTRKTCLHVGFLECSDTWFKMHAYIQKYTYLNLHCCSQLVLAYWHTFWLIMSHFQTV